MTINQLTLSQLATITFNVKIKWSLSGGARGLILYESQQTGGLFRVLTGPNLFDVWKIIKLLHVKCFD